MCDFSCNENNIFFLNEYRFWIKVEQYLNDCLLILNKNDAEYSWNNDWFNFVYKWS